MRARPALSPSDRSRARGRSVILAIFVLSGAAGLAYEVVWARQLVLVFGNYHPGRVRDPDRLLRRDRDRGRAGWPSGGSRSAPTLRMYGILELVLVVVVVITPLLFGLVHDVYRGAYLALLTNPTVLGLVRFCLSLLALGPATILMGATLPTLSRHLTRGRADDLSNEFGRLYMANTLGAIFGTALAGFVLIELLGLTGTLLAGAACSAAAGIAALILSVRDPGSPTEPAAASAEPSDSGQQAARPTTDSLAPEPAPSIASGHQPSPGFRRPSSRSIALSVAFVSGLTSLGYQVLWTRLLSSGTGNTTYIFSTILVIFLVGIAGGAALFTAGLGRGRHQLLALGLAQVAVAFIALAGTAVVSGALFAAPLTITIMVAVLPATLVMGLSLPIASGLAAQRDAHVGSDTGLLLAVNTGGTVCGTFIVPFVLIPTIGSPQSVLLLALVNAGLGLALLWTAGSIRGRAPAVEPAAGVAPEPVSSATAPAPAAPAPRREPAPALLTRLSLGAGRVLAVVAVVAIVVSLLFKPSFVADPSSERIQKAGVLYSSAEDEIASVQAGSINGLKQLWVAGTSMTILTVDAKLMPLLPLMVRPQSKTILAIAFGMGSAYRESLIAGLKVQGVELVPSVPSMFQFYYPDASEVLSNPNGQLAISDGRNFVELTDQTYDIVIVDPPPPIDSSGTAVLYSQEFYRASASRLNPGGVMMEWMPYYQNIDEFRAHVRTYNSIFPYVSILFGPGGYGVFMLGSKQPITLDPANIASILSRPGVASDLSNTPDAHAHSLAQWEALIPTLQWISGPKVPEFGGQGPLITDDHPLTEYFLLRSLYGPKYPYMTPANLKAATPP